MLTWALVGAALAGGDPCLRDSDEMQEVSTALLTMYQEALADQAGRSLGNADVLKADKDRVKTVHKYDSKGWLCSAHDQYHAGMILLQSRDRDDAHRAFELGQYAMEKHVPNGAWLTAYSFDQWQVAQGKPQRFGTQVRMDTHGMCLITVTDEVSDDDRALYKVPPLPDQYRRVLDAHGLKTSAATVDEMRRRKLFCDPEPW